MKEIFAVCTFCIKVKFLHSLLRKGALSPIKFFSLELPERISFSALSASVSSSASSEAARPSSALILVSCKTSSDEHFHNHCFLKSDFEFIVKK